MANIIVSSSFHYNHRLVSQIARVSKLSRQLAQAKSDYKTLINNNPLDMFYPAEYQRDIEQLEAQLKAITG